MPISALESSGQMFLGGATAPGVGLCSSLFLNRPTLLPMPTGTSTAPVLISAAHACSPSSASRMSPDSCSASLCSSPASYCSFSEASPPPLGGTMAEWHLQQDTFTCWRGGVKCSWDKHKKTLPFQVKPSLTPSISLLHSLSNKTKNILNKGRMDVRKHEDGAWMIKEIHSKRWSCGDSLLALAINNNVQLFTL